MLRFDFVDMSKATITADGFIRDTPILTRAGIFEYRNANGTIRREYRPPDEVFHVDHLNSLRGAPVTDGHPGKVNAENTDAIVGTILSEGRQDGTNLLGEVVIHAPKRLGAKKELSLGYSVELDETPGEVDGQKYDAVQRKLRVNHLAVVHRGRAGNAKLRLDRDDAADASVRIEDETMADPVKLVSVRLDNDLEYQASPEVANALKAMTNTVKAEKNRADTLEAERDSLKATVAADKAKHEAALVTARNDAVAQVRTRLALEAEATKHGVEFKSDSTDRAIREAVVEKLAPKLFKFDGKPDTYVEVMFDMKTAEAEASRNAAGQNRSQAFGGAPAPVAPYVAPHRADAAPGAPVKIRSASELRNRMGR